MDAMFPVCVNWGSIIFAGCIYLQMHYNISYGFLLYSYYTLSDAACFLLTVCTSLMMALVGWNMLG
jgi:hypothetical protein